MLKTLQGVKMIFFYFCALHSDREQSCSVDNLSVSLCLIGCLEGILTEFQLEFI